MFKQFLKLLESEYPSTTQLGDLSLSLRNLVSEQTVKLPEPVFNEAKKIIQKIFAATHTQNYIETLKKQLSPEDQALLAAPAKNFSVLMAYDFHYNPKNKKLSLIEVNTNAASFLIGDLIYKSAKQNDWANAREDLFSSFLQETATCNKKLTSVAIIDENVEKQRMYVEFLMYKDLFNFKNIRCDIFDYQNVPVDGAYDFIYNRLTDFTFSMNNSVKLRDAYLLGDIVFSPHPAEYLRISDKRTQLLLQNFVNDEAILKTILFEEVEDWDSLWEERKKYIFKPQRSHGAKAVYRGDSISRKKFDEIKNLPFLAQEYSPPDEVNGFKYDLRFYVYKDVVQLAVARMFQGQVLNFSTAGSGLARLEIVK